MVGPDAGPTFGAEVDVRRGGRFSVAFRLRNGEEHNPTGDDCSVARAYRLRARAAATTGARRSLADQATSVAGGDPNLHVTVSARPVGVITFPAHAGWH